MTQILDRAQSEASETAARFRWTTAHYELMHEQGWFDERRVELLDGEIWQMMGANSPHWRATNLVMDALYEVFPRRQYLISVQSVLKLRDGDVPEPDVAVIAGDIRTMTEIPNTALLIVEVSDATLQRDLNFKASLYARAGIADYWVVDIHNARLIVLRSPVEDPQAPLGWRYASEQTLGAGESVAPLSKPEAPVAVADLLP